MLSDPGRNPEGAPGALNPAPGPKPGAFEVPLAKLQWSDPWRWLAAGWRDFRRAPGIGLFYGATFAFMGWLLLKVFQQAPAYTLALSAGFLLMGPLLCLGLYRVSQQLEQGRSPDFGDSLLAWTLRLGPLSLFAMVLLVLEMIWGRATLVIFAISFDGMPDFKGSLLALLDPENLGFILAWSAVGAFFAWLVFGLCAVSMPMLLDRPVDGITAGITSLRLVMTQSGVMLLWGAIIAALTLAAMLPGFLGLLVVGPVIGHASWHAYRGAVPTTPDDAGGA